MKRVVLAEKPSVARDLAQYLKARTRRDGFFEGDDLAVTWAFGHLVGLKEPHEYDPAWKRWSVESLPIVPARFQLKAIGDDGAKKQLSVVESLMKGAETIVCATDAGREGELIFRYILEFSGAQGKRLLRLWLNSLTDDAIRDAFKKLKPAADYDHLAAAARSRSEADWIVGLNGTRFFTAGDRRFNVLWSVGRVQTPVLAMIVQRDDEIRTFVPEVYFELVTRYRNVEFQHPNERFPKAEDAGELLAKVSASPFELTKVQKKKETSNCPQLFDLTELQREMNRRFSMSAQETLDAAQQLYESKLLTYPRTDSRYLPNEFRGQMAGLLSKLAELKREAIAPLDLQKLKETCKVFDDAKVKDHHAILPTGKLPSGLPLQQGRVFDAVVTRLIAIFHPPCIKEVTTVEGLAGGVGFRARGVRVVDPGWTVLYPKKGEKADKAKADEDGDADQEMPLFEKGESGPHEPSLKQGQTRPPRAFDENTLLAAMETAGKHIEDEELREAMKEKGLGTPATRAQIIETLLHRGYIERDKKRLSATDLGRFLIYLIQDEALKSPEMTGEWEAKLKAIEQGKLDAAEFMRGIVDYTRGIVRGGASRTLDGLGPCPKCKAPVIQGRRGYGCSRWRRRLRNFVLWMEYKGAQIRPQQATRLLARRILLEPLNLEGRGPTILCLGPRGALLELAPPSREAQKREKRTKERSAG